eukprot:maker-scaffold_18-snap-gene-3.6-mRNA-1 protein AED:0.31 eAED:0.31 QI:246/1/0.75/1/0.33/0.25/4/0/426
MNTLTLLEDDVTYLSWFYLHSFLFSVKLFLNLNTNLTEKNSTALIFMLSNFLYPSDIFPPIYNFAAVLILHFTLRSWPKYFQKSFTFGEAFVLIQGYSFLWMDLVCQLTGFIQTRSASRTISQTFLLSFSILPFLLSRIPENDLEIIKTVQFFLVSVFYVFCVSIPLSSYLLEENLILYLVQYIFLTPSHLKIGLYWLFLLLGILPMINHAAKHTKLGLTTIRKLYHFLALALFIPVFVKDREFLILGLGVSSTLLLFVEYIRVFNIRPFAQEINGFYNLFIDHRDQGPAVLTHLYLLLGCFYPIAVFHGEEKFDILLAASGMLILGFGDSLGAIVGSRVGRLHWFGGNKTAEGTLAGFTAAFVATFFFFNLYGFEVQVKEYQNIGISLVLTMLLEAFTKQIDNLVLPVFFPVALMAIKSCTSIYS